MEEKRGIAGVFWTKVDSTGQKRRPQNRGWPDLQPVYRRDFGLAKRKQNHFAKQSAFEIKF